MKRTTRLKWFIVRRLSEIPFAFTCRWRSIQNLRRRMVKLLRRSPPAGRLSSFLTVRILMTFILIVVFQSRFLVTLLAACSVFVKRPRSILSPRLMAVRLCRQTFQRTSRNMVIILAKRLRFIRGARARKFRSVVIGDFSLTRPIIVSFLVKSFSLLCRPWFMSNFRLTSIFTVSVMTCRKPSPG